MKHTILFSIVFALSTFTTVGASESPRLRISTIPVGEGYCRTSVNAASFRVSPLTSNDSVQYISYYDPEGYVTIGKRHLDSDKWDLHRTQYKGNVKDAHNVISIGLDGEGRLHASFDHHGDTLRYCRAVAPGSLELGPLESMTGRGENDVTYPEFYTLPGGDMLFAYRSGASGRGNLVINRYDLKTGKWNRVHDVVIDGEGERNAYWQMFADPSGTIHLSWVWRETWLVETNHDICYAYSDDGARTWKRSDGTAYELPIRESTAEIAWRVPQNYELINQTGMTADSEGHPYVATYWREQGDSVPQYRLVWHDGKEWRMTSVGNRRTPFSLSGGGTKKIPIARPKIVSDGRAAFYIFRDEERGSKVSMAYTPELGVKEWSVSDLTDTQVDSWEPSIDGNLWNSRRRLDIFVEQVFQGDGEKVAEDVAFSTPVNVISVEF